MGGWVSGWVGDRLGGWGCACGWVSGWVGVNEWFAGWEGGWDGVCVWVVGWVGMSGCVLVCVCVDGWVMSDHVCGCECRVPRRACWVGGCVDLWVHAWVWVWVWMYVQLWVRGWVHCVRPRAQSPPWPGCFGVSPSAGWT